MEKSVKRILIGIALVCTSIFLFGCGAGSTDTSGSGGNDTSEKRKLIVGTDAAYAPMEYMDEKGNIVGIDIDIVKAVAEAAGFEVEIKHLGWEPLFPALENGEIDFAVSSITIDEERQLLYDFSDPYFVANQLILVPESSDIASFNDLKDKRVSAQINTTGHTAVKELLGKTSKNIVATETMPLAITELINGNADAAVGDNAVIIEYQAQNANVKLKTVEDDSFEKEYYGLMVQKGNKEVVDLLNKGIEIIKSNGKLKEITDQDVE